MVIDHDPGLAALFEYAPCFTQALGCVWTVVYYAVGVDHIESVIRKGKMLRIGYLNIWLIPRQLTAASSAFHCEASLG